MDCFSSTIKKITACVWVCTFVLFLSGISFVFGADVYLDGRVVGCGDGVVESGESCDLTALNNQSCTTLGFSSGVLLCTPTCIFDTSACVVGGGGGGGGGGGSNTNSAKSLVAFEGRSMPFGNITLLIDGAIVASTTADQLGQFSFSARNLPKGTYQFDVYGTDSTGIQTSTYSLRSTVAQKSVLKIDGIFLGPSFTSDMLEVAFGKNITFSGFAVPDSRTLITLRDQYGHTTFFMASTTAQGTYSYTVQTGALQRGYYSGSAQSFKFSASSSPSRTIWVRIGDINTPRTDVSATCPARGDLNSDCKVNLTDFSILMFWFRQELRGDFMQREKTFLSGDGKADLVDFSIIFFNWTG